MVRTIIKPTDNKLTIRLPDNLIGKVVEVLAFELKPSPEDQAVSIDMEKRVKALGPSVNAKYASSWICTCSVTAGSMGTE